MVKKDTFWLCEWGPISAPKLHEIKHWHRNLKFYQVININLYCIKKQRGFLYYIGGIFGYYH